MNSLLTSQCRRVVFYNKDGIVVNTYYTLNGYETLVCHHKFCPDEFISVEKYTSIVQAYAGHERWVEKSIKDDLYDIFSYKNLKMSFLVLIKLLSKISTQEYPLKFSNIEANKNYISIKIDKGNSIGNIIYNTKEYKIVFVSQSWNDFFQKVGISKISQTS